jgi:hypothetical protein
MQGAWVTAGYMREVWTGMGHYGMTCQHAATYYKEGGREAVAVGRETAAWVQPGFALSR